MTSTTSRNKPLRRVIFTSLCVLIWICIWEIAAIIIDNPLLLPSPITVAKRLFSLACETEFYVTTAASLWRIARGLIIGTLIGIFTSALASRFDFFQVLFCRYRKAFRCGFQSMKQAPSGKLVCTPCILLSLCEALRS